MTFSAFCIIFVRVISFYFVHKRVKGYVKGAERLLFLWSEVEAPPAPSGPAPRRLLPLPAAAVAVCVVVGVFVPSLLVCVIVGCAKWRAGAPKDPRINAGPYFGPNPRAALRE